MVVYKGSGAEASSFSGLSIYFPPSIDVFDQGYAYAVSNPSGWIDFLESYYTAGQGIVAEELPAFLTTEPEVTLDAAGVTVEGTLDMVSVENLMCATISYGIPLDDGSVAYFGDETHYAFNDETGAADELYAEPEGIIVPQVLSVDPDGNATWSPTSDVGLYADLPAITYDFERLESGEHPFVVSLVVTDYGANSTTISTVVDVP